MTAEKISISYLVGETVLHWTVRKNQTELFELFVSLADVNIQTNKGMVFIRLLDIQIYSYYITSNVLSAGPLEYIFSLTLQ